MLLAERAVIQFRSGRLQAATATLVESVALSWDIRNDATLTRALRGLAAVAADTDQPVEAARLLGASDAIDASTPIAIIAAERDRDIVDWCLARLDGPLDVTTLDRERNAGTSLTVEQAVALAREVARPGLDAARVAEIWLATQALDPGPVPMIYPADLHLGSLPVEIDVEQILTAREREVLTLLCQRQTDLEIAAQLFISPRTANRHVSNILSKLEATNRREAAAIAARVGLI
jgi:DNA-binding CsgD family transcriptional regulator